ncbi:MAG TPA: S8 family serine peptidase [Verrucomicrobiae bacterium]|nr:S8 family serine peptidase [Verrucomicrobiae bacterium]
MDTIGITLLRAVTTNLNGADVRVGQVEGGAPAWEVNPGDTGLPVSEFTWFADGMEANAFTNSLGTDSSHADFVGYLFYSFPDGVITNVAHVDNYEASYFSQVKLPSLAPVTDSVVNLSFTITGISLTVLEGYDLVYDRYAASYNTIFIGATGDGGTVGAPSTCYNGIGVGAYGGATGVGPTPDNGRAKPDIVAPGGASSFSAPLVSGSVAILEQAGQRGDGGNDTNSATDSRTLKALLLNGAVKPSDWANPSPSPLDPRYGAGILNVFNSYSQLAAGKHSFIASGSVPLGSAHPPGGTAGDEGCLYGWDFNNLSSSSTNDEINHYYFNLATGLSNAAFNGTASLVWNRQAGQSSVNNLDLFLYQVDSGSLMAESTSIMDNVEHISIGNLTPGRYDLQVLKHGGTMVSSNESYALAFEFFVMPLNAVRTNGNIALNWPIYPAGFRLESSSSLTSPTNWTSSGLTAVLTNNQNLVILNPSPGSQFFRLIRP